MSKCVNLFTATDDEVALESEQDHMPESIKQTTIAGLKRLIADIEAGHLTSMAISAFVTRPGFVQPKEYHALMGEKLFIKKGVKHLKRKLDCAFCGNNQDAGIEMKELDLADLPDEFAEFLAGQLPGEHSDKFREAVESARLNREAEEEPKH